MLKIFLFIAAITTIILSVAIIYVFTVPSQRFPTSRNGMPYIGGNPYCSGVVIYQKCDLSVCQNYCLGNVQYASTIPSID